jgi:adenosine deaminase CECR1
MNLAFQNDKIKYNDTRNRFLNADKNSRSYEKLEDYISMSPQEAALEDILENYMDNQRTKFKENTLQYSNQGLIFPPEHPFYSQKKLIQQTSLFQKVFRKMPKGGLLHIHNTAGLSLDKLIGLMTSWNTTYSKDDDLHICIASPLCPHRTYPVGTLLFQKQLTNEIKPYFCSLDTFMEEPSAINTLYELLSFETDTLEEEAYVWDKFNLIFVRTAALFSNATFYEQYEICLLNECLDDNISYVELRSGFESFRNDNLIHQILSKSGAHPKDYIYYADLLTDVDICNPDTQFLKIIYEAVQKVNDARKKTDNKQIKVKVILNANRKLNPAIPNEREKICAKIDSAITIINSFNEDGSNYKDFVIGFDFVSEEDRGQTTDAYIDILYEASQSPSANAALRINCINFFPHDGESNWSDNNNMFSAVLIARHRIGHGINVIKYPSLISDITSTEQYSSFPEPVLEICPISNQLLRYCRDLREHPLPTLKKSEIPCIISNDDPQILGNPGLSYDLWEAYMGMGLSLKDMKELIFITYFYKHYTYMVDITHQNLLNELAILETASQDFQTDWSAFITDVTKNLPQQQ